MKKDNCIFCQIASKKLPAHIVWENETFVAFLSIFPNTNGATVVIPKEHYPSYGFELEDNVLSQLVLAAKKVANIIDAAFDDVGRTALVLEGFGVDHVHAKLFPLHGTQQAKEEWRPIKSSINTFYEKYEGFVSSHDGPRESDDRLCQIAEKIRCHSKTMEMECAPKSDEQTTCCSKAGEIFRPNF